MPKNMYIFSNGSVSNSKITLHSGRLSHNYGKSPVLMGRSTITMAIFNSYVKLPEGVYL